MTASVEGDETIELPWRVLPDYRCFGCSPSNDRGLQLRFVRTEAGIECTVRFSRAHESYPGVVHGGMSTTVCDEIMGNLLVLRTGLSVFTTSLRARYVSPLSVGTVYRCIATTEVSAGDRGPYQARAHIVAPDGKPVVFTTGSYQPVTADQARCHMDLSDHEAQLIQQALSELETPTREKP